MIPKKIHYCWFGRGEKSKLAIRCIESWKKYCPDYEIIEWNEDNYDVNKNEYTSWCYRNKKWAFLSDYVRLDVVNEYGGIYFDTDVELIKPLDDLVKYDAFYGLEKNDTVATGLGFGSMSNHIIVSDMKKEYEELHIKDDFVPIGCPLLNTKVILKYCSNLNEKKQNVCGAEILPVDYLNPYDDPTGRLNKTKNTISIHWYSKSALNKRQILRSKLTRPFHRLFGEGCFNKLKIYLKR